MATFDGEQFIWDQLRSIEQQTVFPNELVVCDDGSSDRTVKILAEFKRQAPFPVRILVNDETLGSTRNFDKAIRQCRNDVITLCDQDDVWCEHKLQRIKEAFLNHPRIVGAFSDARLIDERGQVLKKSLWRSVGATAKVRRQLGKGGHRAFQTLLRRTVITGAVFAFQKDAYDLVGEIPSSWVHDAWIAINIIRQGSIYAIPEALVGYRQHESNQIGVREETVTARLSNMQFLESAQQRAECLKDYLEKTNADKPYFRESAQKVKHLKRRKVAERSCVAAISELATLRYFKYSGGWTSFGKDFVWSLRHLAST